MDKWKFLALVLIVTSLTSAASHWPPLPKSGFIKGRLAQKSDIAKGNAVFVLEGMGGTGEGVALPIKIPQYAFYKEEKINVFIVQAERRGPLSLVGARSFSGKRFVGLLSNFTLLGTHPKH